MSFAYIVEPVDMSKVMFVCDILDIMLFKGLWISNVCKSFHFKH